MTDLATVLLVLALLLAVLGALRFDLVKLLLRNLIGTPDPGKGMPAWREHGHADPATPKAHEAAPAKPPFHRSGRRH